MKKKNKFVSPRHQAEIAMFFMERTLRNLLMAVGAIILEWMLDGSFLEKLN